MVHIMKICGKCNSSFSDDALNFCLNCGTALTGRNETATIEIPRKTAPQKSKNVRNALIVGGVLAVIGFFGCAGVGLYFFSNLDLNSADNTAVSLANKSSNTKNSSNSANNTIAFPTNSSGEKPGKSPTPAGSKNDNTRTTTENGSDIETTSESDDTAQEQDVIDTMNAAAEAVSSNDRAALDRLIAPEYKERSNSGQSIGKKQLMEAIKILGGYNLYYTDLKPKITADGKAVVTGIGHSRAKVNGIEIAETFSLTCNLVYRNDRWQAVSATSKTIK